MSTMELDANRRNASAVARDVNSFAKDGYTVILVFGDDVPPERVLKVLAATIGNHKVQIVVRHAELREYVMHAAVGAAIGGAGGAVAAALKAMAGGKVCGSWGWRQSCGSWGW